MELRFIRKCYEGKIVGEKEPDQGALIPDRLPNKESKGAIKNLGDNGGIVEHGVMIEQRVIITPHVTISPELHTIITIRSLHSNNNNIIENRGRYGRIVTSLVRIANSPVGGLICSYLLEHGGATIPELEEMIPCTPATASRSLKNLAFLGVVERRGVVEYPYRTQNPGPKIPVFVLKGADPVVSINAQKRFAALQINQDPERRAIESKEQETKERIVENQIKTDENLKRVLELIQPPLDQMAPLYEIMDSLNILEDEERSAIREYFNEESAKQNR